ncbi:MAG: CPCC family cysteine-rich protein [Planctomycetota bacterium]
MLTDRPHQCPCCDFFSLAARFSYEICPVCYWEDDGQDLDRAHEVSGPNHITLAQARRNFENMGASDPSAVRLVVAPEERRGLRRERRTLP